MDNFDFIGESRKFKVQTVVTSTGQFNSPLKVESCDVEWTISISSLKVSVSVKLSETQLKPLLREQHHCKGTKLDKDKSTQSSHVEFLAERYKKIPGWIFKHISMRQTQWAGWYLEDCDGEGISNENQILMSISSDLTEF